MTKDYYNILGVDKNVDEKTLKNSKKKYRKQFEDTPKLSISILPKALIFLTMEMRFYWKLHEPVLISWQKTR